MFCHFSQIYRVGKFATLVVVDLFFSVSQTRVLFFSETLSAEHFLKAKEVSGEITHCQHKCKRPEEAAK